jgi:rhamnogalacturonan acetylesterase
MLFAKFKTFLAYGVASIAVASAAPTVYLAGDSTMAATGNNDGDTAGMSALTPVFFSI